MKVQIGIFECTGIMGQDLIHPYIQSTTVLCDLNILKSKIRTVEEKKWPVNWVKRLIPFTGYFDSGGRELAMQLCFSVCSLCQPGDSVVVDFLARREMLTFRRIITELIKL